MHRSWEYTHFITNDMNHRKFKELGLEGWELVSVVLVPQMASHLSPQPVMMPMFFFKREIINADQS